MEISSAVGATSRSIISGTEITAELTADGEVSGYFGRNGFQGSYRAEDGGISFGEVAITEMYCAEPQGVVEQDGRLRQTFAGAERYRFADGNLAPTDGCGKELVQ